MWMKIGAALVLVIVAVGIGVWLVNSHESSTGSTANVTVTTGDAYRITAAPKGTKPKVVVTMIEDFQCPACRAFESTFSDALAKLRQDPTVALDYTPIAFLDQMSSTQYSSRSANASACVAESTAKNGDFSTWLKFHNLLYANQPEENTAGLTDDQLNEYAEQAGAHNVHQCIDSGQFRGWVKNVTTRALQSGVNATPTIRINGKPYELSTPDAFLQAVAAAAKS